METISNSRMVEDRSFSDEATVRPATYGLCGEHQVQAVDGDGNHGSDGDPSIQKPVDSEFQWTAKKKVLDMLLSGVNFVTFVAFSMLAPFFPNEVGGWNTNYGHMHIIKSNLNRFQNDIILKSV